jgi:hypothetical protein
LEEVRKEEAREKGGKRERERERDGGGGGVIGDKPLYRQDKVSSSYHINLRVLSAGPLEMTAQTNTGNM